MFFVIYLFSGFFAFSNQLISPNPSCTCEKKSGDKYEQPVAFDFGLFKGKCIDSCRFRGVIELKNFDNEISKVKSEGKIFYLANVLHNEEFRIAKINPYDFSEIEIGFEEFTKGVFHTFLKFNLKDSSQDILLFNQNNITQKPLSTRGLIISSEGVPPLNRKYSLFESALGQYLIIHRLTTPEESHRWISLQKNPLNFYKVKIEASRIPQVLENAIKISLQENYNSTYDLFFNNCASSVLKFLEPESLSKNKFSLNFWTKNLSISGPLGTLSFLTEKGLTESNTKK